MKEAQNFLNNVQVFVKSNPEEFDILTVMEFVIMTKSVLGGLLDDDAAEKWLDEETEETT